MTISGRRALSAAAVLFALIALALAARPAAAAPIGSDGVVHACYKAKGKPKGALRVVKAGKPCKAKKGEKPIAWTIFGAPGATGAQGATGETATGGATKQDLLTLLGLIQQQSTMIDQLTSQLDGLTGQLGSICDQLSLVTGQSNALRTVIGGLGLNGVLTTLGGLLQIPALPAALDPFSCV
ncbi:MAG TPA: hypothetical protein VHF58_06025 [Solirubrobacterales bacterium]|nr:hypothetical protein [Solirubrobacterales bacterium]